MSRGTVLWLVGMVGGAAVEATLAAGNYASTAGFASLSFFLLCRIDQPK